MVTADTSSHTTTVTLAEPGEDIELKAIAYIRSVISGLDHHGRLRALSYVLHRAKEDAERETGQKPNLA